MHADERSVLATLQNVAFAGWRDAPQVEDIRRWHQLGRAVQAAHPGRGCCFDVVVRGRPDFGEAMRRETVKFASDPDIFQLGFAHVVIAPGLVGSAVRAFIGTILLVARPPAPAKVFGEVDAAVEWMAPSLVPDGITPAVLRNACAELRMELDR